VLELPVQLDELRDAVGRSRLSRSSRYFARSASGSKPSSVIAAPDERSRQHGARGVVAELVRGAHRHLDHALVAVLAHLLDAPAEAQRLARDRGAPSRILMLRRRASGPAQSVTKRAT
jgi:hypothetical protein